MAAISGAMGAATGCRAQGDPPGAARVAITFAPSGRVTNSPLEAGPYGGTKTGGCVARVFRGLQMKPFSGGPVTVHRTVRIP